MSSGIRLRGIRWMTYAWQQEVFEEESGKVGAATEPGLPVDGEGLLTDGPLARVAQLCDLLMPKPLQLQQGDVAFGRREAPLLELTIDGRAEALEHILRLAAPALGVCPRCGQFTVQPFRLRPCGCELPAVDSNPGQRQDEHQDLERLRDERSVLAIVNDGVDGHE